MPYYMDCLGMDRHLLIFKSPNTVPLRKRIRTESYHAASPTAQTVVHV